MAIGAESSCKDTFPFLRLSGSHRQIGRAYGEAFRDLVHLHLDYAAARLHAHLPNVTKDNLLRVSLKYQDFVGRCAPYLDEEVQGVAEGANLDIASAYLLQLRAEMYSDLRESAECTSFAVAAAATSDDIGLVGQNADLPAFYRDVAVILEIHPDDGPACLLLTPAGQVSHVGINNLGLGVFANFLHCGGWRVGFPRYFLSRVALSSATVDEAVACVSSLPRASSRNLIMLDKAGGVVDMETTPSAHAEIHPSGEVLAHANHYVAPNLVAEDTADDQFKENSRARHARMEQLLKESQGHLDVPSMKKILCDRETFPHCLCRAPGDEEARGRAASDVITYASIIAQPSEGKMFVAVGPPREDGYHCYELH